MAVAAEDRIERPIIRQIKWCWSFCTYKLSHCVIIAIKLFDKLAKEMPVSGDWCAYVIRIIVGIIIKMSIRIDCFSNSNLVLFVIIEYERFVAFDINLSYISDQH